VGRYKKGGVDTQASYIVPLTIVCVAAVVEFETLGDCQASQVLTFILIFAVHEGAECRSLTLSLSQWSVWLKESPRLGLAVVDPVIRVSTKCGAKIVSNRTNSLAGDGRKGRPTTCQRQRLNLIHHLNPNGAVSSIAYLGESNPNPLSIIPAVARSLPVFSPQRWIFRRSHEIDHKSREAPGQRGFFGLQYVLGPVDAAHIRASDPP